MCVCVSCLSFSRPLSSLSPTHAQKIDDIKKLAADASSLFPSDFVSVDCAAVRAAFVAAQDESGGVAAATTTPRLLTATR